MVIYGGYTVDGATSSDVHVYDLSNGTWELSKAVSVGTAGSKPSARRGHTAVCLENKMIVFGNDLFCPLTISQTTLTPPQFLLLLPLLLF